MSIVGLKLCKISRNFALALMLFTTKFSISKLFKQLQEIMMMANKKVKNLGQGVK